MGGESLGMGCGIQASDAVITADDSATLRHAAELLEADAECLRECHNADPLRPTWEDEDEARASHDDALCTALRLRMLAKRMTDRQGASADY